MNVNNFYNLNSNYSFYSKKKANYLYAGEQIQKHSQHVKNTTRESEAVLALTKLKKSKPISWQEALALAEEGCESLLLTMLKTGHLFHLSLMEKSEICEFAIVNEKRDILLHLAKLGLSSGDREDIFSFALEKNDKDLLEIVLKGIRGQIPLNFRKWSEGRPIHMLKTYQEEGADPSIISLLCSNASLSPKDLQNVEWKKFLAHIWNIEGKCIIQGEEIEYGGGFVNFFIDRILVVLSKYKAIHTLAFKIIKESQKKFSDETLMLTYLENLPILLHGGSMQHQINIVLMDSYLLLCNKGAWSDMPVKVYKINSNLVTIDLIRIIKFSQDNFGSAQAQRFFNHELPVSLEGEEFHELNHFLMKNWIEPLRQEGDNCIWESLKTSILGLNALLRWTEAVESSENVKIDQVILEALKEAETLFNVISLWGIEQYFIFLLNNPTEKDYEPLHQIIPKAYDRFGKEKNMQQSYFAYIYQFYNDFFSTHSHEEPKVTT